MNRFVEHATQILEAAESAAQAGCEPSNYSIFLGGPGGMLLVADSEWQLEAQRQQVGADQAFRVTAGDGLVRVDGADGARRCHFECEVPARAAQFLLHSRPASWLALAVELPA